MYAEKEMEGFCRRKTNELMEEYGELSITGMARVQREKDGWNT